jgi:peroxiredoxin Q/BCP
MYRMEYRTEPGDLAPDFTLPSTDGRDIGLYGFRNKNTVLLFFFDPGNARCLQVLSALGREHASFAAAGSVVLPVAVMSVGEGKALAEEMKLPFPVLCDEDHSVVRMYRVGECSDTSQHACFEVITGVKDPQALVIDQSSVIRTKHSVRADKQLPGPDQLLAECRKAAG